MQKGVTQAELAQILDQLRALAQLTHPPAHLASVPTLPPTVTQSYPPQPSYATPSPAQPNQYPVTQPIYPPQPAYPPPTYSQPKQEPVSVSIPLTQSASNGPSTSTTPAVPVDVSLLFRSLIQAGVVTASASSTPTGAGATAKADSPPTEGASKDLVGDYRRAILTASIKLNSIDIIKYVTACLCV